MVVVSYSGKEINAKLVYYGAGLSGKTTNLESIYEAVPETSRGKMVSMKTQSDRTLFFDLLPLDLGEIMGFKTRFLLYTVPGQVFYNATRKLVLKGADAIVFVADSEVGKMEENKESLANLRTNLAEYGLKLEEIPWVIQYNKRDLPEVYTIEQLDAELNPERDVQTFEAVATQGKGVFETFRGISHLLMEKVTRDLRRTKTTGSAARPARHEEPPAKDAPPALGASARSEIPAAVVPARAQTIARETRESPRTLSSPASFEYGRELFLPEDPPESEPSHPASHEKTEKLGAPAFGGAESDGGEAPGPAVRHHEARKVDAIVTPGHATPVAGPAKGLAATIGSEVATAPDRQGHAPVNRPAASAAAASTSSPVELVVPLAIPRQGTREIVLRIVLTEDDA